MHPTLKSMSNLGCQSQFKLSIAFQIYLELCEAEALWDVKYLYNKNFDLLYFTAKKSKSMTEHEIIVPIPASSDISPSWLESVQNTLCGEEHRRITLAIKEPDSSTVYYSITKGLIPPDSPDTARKKKQGRHDQYKVKAEIQRQKQELFQKAQLATCSVEEPTTEQICEEEL